MTDGQRLALEQLREIEAASDGVLEVVSITDSRETKPQDVIVDLSIYCDGIESVPEGLLFQETEPLRMTISPDFPFKPPSISTLHTRWAGFSHVQWKSTLCLYLSTSTEWKANDGMFGFIQRLDLFLRQGAVGQLDPTGAPLHPPVAYTTSGHKNTVIPRVDTPPVGDAPWIGFAHLRTVSECRVDLCGWSPIFAKGVPLNVAAAILLHEPMPFEFPIKVSDLIAELTTRGVPQEQLLLLLQLTVLRNDDDAPLYIVLGCPMRGIRGSRKLRQHLVVWYLEPIVARGLRLSTEKFEPDEVLQRIGSECEQIVLDWAKEASVVWCHVRENRPEVTVRRDSGAPLAWFAGLTVSIWGCGALGSHIGEFLTRAGVRKLVLRDNQIVSPGVLARQQFDDNDIGRAKAEALGSRLKRIRPDLEVDCKCLDVLTGTLSSEDWTDGADVVIDATASASVIAKLELWRWIHPEKRTTVVSMVIGHRAKEGLVLVAGADHSGGPADVSRSAKLEACKQAGCEKFISEFWPERQLADLFQPEPGCSENTFVGSAADVAVLAGMMINLASVDLADPCGRTATAHLVCQPQVGARENQHFGFGWSADLTCNGVVAGYQIRIAEAAWKDMLAWAQQSPRRHGRYAETGGLLFGERDDAARVLWVTEVSGPPPDSRASPERFFCGVETTQEANRDKRQASRGSVQYVGMWHTHPESAPLPSSTDLDAMCQLTCVANPSPTKVLLLILGTPSTLPCVGAYLYNRRDFERRDEMANSGAACQPAPTHVQGP